MFNRQQRYVEKQSAAFFLRKEHPSHFLFFAVFFLYLFVSSQVFCRNSAGFEIAIGDFLASAKNDLLLKNQEEKISFLRTTSPNTPFLNKVEFRTRTDEGFDHSGQRYSLRLYPNGQGETKAGEKVYHTTVKSNRTQYDLLLHRALKKRYIMVINLLKELDYLDLKKKLMLVQEDKAIVLNSRVNTPDFRITEFIKAKDTLVELQIEIIGLENKISVIEESIRSCMQTEDSIALKVETLAGVDLVRKTFLQFDHHVDDDNIYLKNSNYDKEIVQGMLELEKAEGKRYLNFFEAAYDNDEGGRPSDSISFGVGINLPFIRSNRMEVNRRKLQFLSAKGEHEELKRSLGENVRLLSREMNNMFRQYDVLIEEKTTGGTESALKKYMETEGIDPLMLLDMQESIVKTDILVKQKQYEIYTTYLEYLDISGQLTRRPIRNYLSPDLGQIEL